MKRKNNQNLNGISISDSIVMSVKRKNTNYRKPFSAAIAIIGFVSILMSFLGMFKFQYDAKKMFLAAVVFTAFYLTLALINGKAMVAYGGSIVIFIVAAYRRSAKIALGFKFVYNIIFHTAYHTEINYYRSLKQSLEVSSVTTLFIFYMWLLAIVVYYFTVCRPNPVLPLMLTFPVLELGMYHGIEVPVFWGMLCIAYWLSLLAMSTIDVGEYSGGQSGFVRKNNLFFPKRHMKLKVTEKCGAMIVASVMLIATVSYGMLKITNYERSEKLNQKRRNITEALNDFSFENFAESFSNLAAAMGFDFEYENHKLGDNDHVKYKNVTDLTVTLGHNCYGAIYLKDYAGSVYKNNEWFDLPAAAYENKVFNDFKEYDIYPQDFPAMFSPLIDPMNRSNNIAIKPSQKKQKHIYAPYGTIASEDITYNRDLTVSAKKSSKGVSRYNYFHFDVEDVVNSLTYIQTYSSSNVREVYSVNDISDDKPRNDILKYCKDNQLITFDEYFPVDIDIPSDKEFMLENGSTLMGELLQKDYKQFVYENYLKVPNTKEMEEVRDHYSDIVSGDHPTVMDKFNVLTDIKDRIRNECSYSLYPRKTPSNRDFVNYFLLENKKGYCTHYASAGVILARMAGIPARYATGYIIVEDDIKKGKHNPDGTITIDVKDNRSHAWTEVYIDGVGWLPFEFTAGYSSKEINTEPTSAPTSEATSTVTSYVTTTTQEATSNTSKASVSASSTTLTSSSKNTVTSANSSSGFGKGSGKPMPKALKRSISFLLLIVLIVLLFVLRRYIILRSRHKKFTNGRSSTRVRNMYSYAEKLLETLKLQSEHGNFRGFANDVEKRLGGDYFDKGSFTKLTDIALKASFGNGTPDDEDIKLCEKTINDIASSLYNKSSFINKLKLMFINVLK